MKAAKHITAAASQVSRGIQTAHAVAGLPGPPAWAGYWTFVTATIILAFMFYTAKHGTLNTWVGFFSWKSPAPIGTTGGPAAGADGSSPSAAPNANATPKDPLTGSAPSWLPGSGALNFGQNLGTFLMHPFSGTK